MSPLPRIDQRLAVGTGRRLVPGGPQVSPAEARQVVDSLYRHAARAAGHVREVTGLDAPQDSQVLVVDRRRWIEANVQSFSTLLAGLAEPSPGRRSGSSSASVQMGALLSYLATRVLGQYDPFAAQQGVPGRLLLVAPNVLAVERQLGVDPEDFRLWVCLHEETHRVQFGHARWLPDHLRLLLADVLAQADLGDPEVLGRLVRRLRPGARRGDGSLVDLLTTAEQRERIDAITAVMSLLEGHADVMMDRVGPDVVPSVRTIRHRFTRRRERGGPDRVVRRLLGVEAKLAQYRDGARFVRHVVRRVGVDGFNTVFTSPQTLPTLEEIHQPRRWLDRTR
ncbi:coenzyme F420 biosynthesis-associated protein [Auraticoccus sp. F435]|uniref:Coenzyme F420 biosynthesis-associated protein n=1 Tax=Auraticoccus cholistanensis TaxID=2656650 RepID=A0A6A9UW91_9ACTN|nr:zinc-dependent metalloprotease [Auraticoccus cholistanensis]MVA76978.1 coenzyme F420 biosynthesis-associated protein [Auraticoccus cholistanensis]